MIKTKKQIKKILSTGFLLVFLLTNLLFTPPQAKAQSKTRLIISPPRIQLEANPGETVQAQVKITNMSNVPASLTVNTKDMIVVNDRGTPVLVDEEVSGRWSLASWISLSPGTVEVEASSSAVANLAIMVPENALPGGHYAACYFESGPPTPQGPDTELGTGTAVASRLASLIYLTVSGPITEDYMLEDFSTDQSFYEFGPVKFLTKIKNLSDIHIRPKGDIVVKNMFGAEKTILPLNEVNIFPEASRTYENTWDTTWGFGKYSAKLSAVYGPSNQVMEALIYFWIVPVKIAAAILIGLMLLIIIILSIRSHLRHESLESTQTLKKKDEQIKQLKKKLDQISKGPPQEQ
jgi:hypothetical protein